MGRASFLQGTAHRAGVLNVGLVAFNKHIKTEMESRIARPTPLLTGSVEQEAIWDVLLNQNQNVIVEAVAGSGKTSTLMQYVYRLGARAQVSCMTYHGLGLKSVQNSVSKRVQVDQYKVLSILDGMHLACEKKQEKTAKYRISSMVSYAKTYGYGSDVTQAQMESIADRHDVDMNGLASLVYDTVPKVLGVCMRELSTIDFDDMVWLPYVLKLSLPKFDVLCVDEYQDTGLTQQWLAVQSATRLVAVGDKNQSIYSFRGCDGKGFDKLREEIPNIVTLPLTFTRRCPKSHVKLAQTIVPQIQAMPDAPEGVVRNATLDEAVGEMRPGDLVVCRVNAELIGVAYKLLKRGVKAVVRGRDIGAGMVKLVDQAEARANNEYIVSRLPFGTNGASLNSILNHVGEITGEQIAKFNAIPQGRGEMRAANAQDRLECVVELAEDCKTVSELRSVIERLFSDFETDGQPKNAVVLGTVHRTKGLEGERVYVLRPDLIPHPMARKPEDVLAEYNLAYVAVTRATSKGEKGGELVFVGGEGCALFDGIAEQPELGLEAHEVLTTECFMEQEASKQEDNWEVELTEQFEQHRHAAVRRLKQDMRHS